MAAAPNLFETGLDARSGQSMELGKSQLRLMRSDAKTQQELRIRQNAARFDAMGAGGNGLFMARQLEHIYQEVLKEEFPPMNALSLFEIDSRVQPGARSHTVRRMSQQGEAEVYRGNSRDVPRVGISQDEEEFPVRHYVTSFEIDVFERLSGGFGGVNLEAEFREACQEVLMEFWNEKTWKGDDANGIYGILNYLFMPKWVFPIAPGASSDHAEFLFLMNKAANFAHEESRTVYSPNAVVMSPRLLRYMRTTRVPGVSDNVKLIDDFLAANPKIQTVEEAHELQGAGPGGADVILFFRRTARSISNALVQSPTMLPVQHDGLADKVYLYMSHGGVVMREVLNNLAVFVDASNL